MSGPDPKASAAAMDALNLDDLFLGGDDDDAQGGMADSLFADMDLDLGDIMDGIIGDEASVGEEVGGGGGASGSLTGDFDFSSGGFSPSSSHGTGGGRDSAPPQAQDPGTGASSSTIGKKTKSRTARSNPFLAMAQAKEKESQSKMKRESALAKEARELSLGNSDILSPTAKRTRRKSKKVMDEEDDYVPDPTAGIGVGSSISTQPTKKSKRTIKRRSSKLEKESSMSSILSNSASILPQHEAKVVHQQQTPSSMSMPQAADALTPTTSSDSTPKPPQTWEEVLKARQKIVQQAQDSVSKFGLAPSRTTFFPYINHLPHEVDVKQQKGKKVYPMLEKLMVQSAVNSAESKKQDGRNDGEKMVATTSPIYQLFDTHLGGLVDCHGTVHSPPALQASLLTSIQSASNMTKPKSKKNKDATNQHLIEELSKLYLGTMKQSLFLRQNLWNTERWCEKNFRDFHKEDDSKDPVKRKEVEWVLRMITKQREKDQQHEIKSMERKVKQYQHEQQLQKLQKEQKQKTKRLASDPKLLPMSEYLPNAPTHGGPESNPVISVKVRVKVSGWRDKSGARLTARLWGPNGWMVALKRTNSAHDTPKPQSMLPDKGAGAQMPTAIPKSTLNATIAKLDFSSVDPATMEVVVSELVRYDLLPKKEEPPPAEVKKESLAAVAALVAPPKGDAKSSAPVRRSSVPDTTKDDKTKKEDKKTSKSKKRKAKDKESSTLTTATSLSSVSLTTAVVKSSGKRYKPFIPHIPSLGRSGYPPAILAPVSTINTSISAARSTAAVTASTPKNNDIHGQQQRLIQVMYNQILNPALSPTERRQLLANEISTTLTKLQTSHSTNHLPKSLAIQKQVEELQAVYEEDKEIVPENCNTIGLWNWMKHNNYFEKMDRVEDVYDGLEGVWQPELENGLDLNGDGWGALPPVKVMKSPSKIEVTEEGKGVEDKHVAKDDNGSMPREGIESSPLFDRLQSLLVEENDDDDDESNEEGEDDDDDDNLLSNLPPYSPEEFIFGPSNMDGKSSSQKLSLDDDSVPDEGMLDVSALSLDQRTFIQLRAAGLVDKNTTPFFRSPPSTTLANENDGHDHVSLLAASAMHATTVSSNNEDSIEAVLSKMKSKLSTVHIQNNANVATLQHKALSHIKGSNTTSKGSKQINEDLILQKYKHLQKAQKQEKEEKLQKIRTSGRVKTGSNKFDGEQWLPW